MRRHLLLSTVAIKLLADIRNDYETANTQVVISACVGPRGDGYKPSAKMCTDEAQEYQSKQIEVFSDSEADLITG